METNVEEDYKPPLEFKDDVKEPLIELNLTDKTELWLMQWPLNQIPNFDGQQLSIKLHNSDGHLGSFKGDMAGDEFKLFNYESQKPDDAVVFISSRSKPKAVGKIARRVSVVNYPNPDELNSDTFAAMYRSSHNASSAMTSRLISNVVQGGSRARQTLPKSDRTKSTRSGKRKSTISDAGGEVLKKVPKKALLEQK